MKKYNIAQIGTFDLENFGDLLFPNVLEKNLKDRLDVNLVLFSPVGGNKPFEDDVTVYPISDFDKLQKEYNFDAIIVGGGDLLRLDDTVATKDMYKADIPSFDFFINPSIYAEKYNIPLLYNVPGVPFAFTSAQKNLVKAICSAVSYISVRDSRSAEHLSACLENQDITVSPDSVLSIASLYSKDDLKDRFNKFKSDYDLEENKYIVFQCVSTIFPENEDVIAKELDKVAKESGLGIVFMPITYVHNDADVMNGIFSKMKTDNKKFVTDHLSPFEMCALLANSGGYIGSSLHGGIVSIAYGKTACGLNMLGLSKLKGIYKDFGIENNVVNSAENISKTFASAKVVGDSELNGFLSKISSHFDKIAELIKTPVKNESCIISDIIREYYYFVAEKTELTHIPYCTVFFEKDGGFSELNKINFRANKVDEHKFEIGFTIPDGISKLRFDADEGYKCVIKDAYIENGISTQKLLVSNGADYGNFFFFDTTDPQFIIDSVNSGVAKITFDYIPLLENAYTTFTEMINEKYQNDKAISEERIVLLENKFDEEKQKLKSELSKTNRALLEARGKIDGLHYDIDQIKHSFCWRVTAPIRAVSSFRLKCIKGVYFIKRNGIKATIKRLRGSKPKKNYVEGLDAYNKIPDSVRAMQEATVFDKSIKFSVIVPLYNTPKDLLCEMIESVQNQTYKNWELCLADGSDNEHKFVEEIVSNYAKDDNRIIYKKLEKNGGISENTNACLDMATGDYIALFDHDDLLHPSALYEYMKVICEKDADFIYCDEDKFKKLGEGFYDGHFKPDFAEDNLRANNYICHFTVFDKKLLDIVGGFRKEFDGSQDHDMILRLTEKAKHIIHVPKILYHWRISDASVASDPYAKPYTIQAGINAVSEHLQRVGLKGTVESTKVHPNIYRIKYDIIGEPKVSILIPNYNHVAELSTCINSILEKTTYKNYEIIIIENNSNEETFAYYETLKQYPNIKVVVYKPEGGFNYSAINNFGAKFASGEHILLLNNDIEVISPEWLTEMLMFSQRSDVGAVGAKLYYPDDTIQHAGVIIGLLTLAGHAFKNFPREHPGYFGRASFQQDLSCCTAACLMIPKHVFEEVGGLDEKFAVAFNDVDLCMKIRDKGYHIVFTPFAELYHYESKSRGLEDTPEKVKRFQGEIKRFYDKWQYVLDEGDPYYNPNLTLDREDFSEK